MVNIPDATFLNVDFKRLALLNIAAAYPVIDRAIRTAINVATTLMLAGKREIATSGRMDPVGNEIIDAIAAA